VTAAAEPRIGRRCSRSVRIASLAAALFLLGAPAALAGSDPWGSLHRPLRLKPLPAGAACPVTPTRRLDGGRLVGLGTGPVYPGGFSFDRDDRQPGWLASKTIWTWPAALLERRVRVLVRGRRLDGSDPVRFQLGPQWDTAPVTKELRLDTTRPVGSFSNSAWGTTVMLLLVRTPGCYGLQLDSASATSVVVLRAARR
jgi:hypothetical protein